MSHADWIRLPGLFRWSEVCDVALAEAGLHDRWRFVVRVHSLTPDLEPLYTVHGVDVCVPRPQPKVAPAADEMRG